MDITDFIEKKSTLSDGIFYTDEKKPLSYPKDGHALVYQIENSSFWFKHKNECIAQTLANFKPSGTLLDVGGGNGFTTILLQELGYQIISFHTGKIAFSINIIAVIRIITRCRHKYLFISV